MIVVPALEALTEAPNLPELRSEVERRYGTIDLLDVLKETDHLTGFTGELTSIASREITDAETARRRKLLVAFALGANIGSESTPKPAAGRSRTAPSRS